MILVTVGSQKFQFNRLLKEIDKLIEEKVIKEEVFAQIGHSDYKPKHYKYVDFLSSEEFTKKIKESNLIITHAGTGVIINALKLNKKVIAIPRLSKYKEHVDNHQIQIINQFSSQNFIESVEDIKLLADTIEKIKNKKFKKYISSNEKIIETIIEFIEKE